MNRTRFTPKRPYKTQAFGWIHSVEVSVESEMIDVTSIGSTHRQRRAGIQSVSLGLTIEPEGDWYARIGEQIDVDEVFGNESSAIRLTGPMIVCEYRTNGSLGGGMTATVELVNVGYMRTQQADPTVLIMRQRIEQIRAEAGLT